MGEAFEHLHDMGVLGHDLSERLRGAVGFRNIAIHNYRTIDWQIVFTIIHEHLDDFRQYAKAIAARRLFRFRQWHDRFERRTY